MSSSTIVVNDKNKTIVTTTTTRSATVAQSLMSPSSSTNTTPAAAKTDQQQNQQQQQQGTIAAAAGDTPEQRIARYKELRRQQLREGVAAVLDREKNAAGISSAISSKRSPRPRNDDPDQSPRVRTTRASRLRQQATGDKSTSTTSLENERLFSSKQVDTSGLPKSPTYVGRFTKNKAVGVSSKDLDGKKITRAPQDDAPSKSGYSNPKSPIEKLVSRTKLFTKDKFNFDLSSPKSTASEASEKSSERLGKPKPKQGMSPKRFGDDGNISPKRFGYKLTPSHDENKPDLLTNTAGTSGTNNAQTSDKNFSSNYQIVDSNVVKSDLVQDGASKTTNSSEDNVFGRSRRPGDHLGRKDKSSKRKNSFNMTPNIAVEDFDDRNRSRSRRLLAPTNNTTSSSTTTTTSSSTNRRSPQRSASLCKPNHHRPTITQRPPPENQSPTPKSTTSHDHQENHRVDVLTQRTKDALLKVEKLKIRRVVSSKVTSGEKKTTVERKSQVAAMCEVEEQKPISILKRKSGTCTLPVTFSPEVVLESEKSQHASRQGILKKRLSMEEVTNIQQSETRGRRSSLDITARSSGHHHHHHHGILKRKTSRSEDEDFNYTVEDYAGDSPPHDLPSVRLNDGQFCP
ncbi:uncharacterized protein DDB_G0271670-like [Ctenocephalides felis]|uniref:uncharacterized protein DDB_G0271670-like n=1 Tax=Ctenocephalides felis TaxID=7515 RepID=UPI000E6E4CF9|nr:uncharacterized protein DDB_G0271670-like [Ctenocephalides felis]